MSFFFETSECHGISFEVQVAVLLWSGVCVFISLSHQFQLERE